MTVMMSMSMIKKELFCDVFEKEMILSCETRGLWFTKRYTIFQIIIFSNLCLLLSGNGFPYLAVALTALQTCFLSVAD